MFKKLLLVMSLLFIFSCEDNIVEEESSMKLWLNGEEIDVEAEYKRITTYGEEVEYFNIEDDHGTATVIAYNNEAIKTIELEW